MCGEICFNQAVVENPVRGFEGLFISLVYVVVKIRKSNCDVFVCSKVLLYSPADYNLLSLCFVSLFRRSTSVTICCESCLT